MQWSARASVSGSFGALQASDGHQCRRGAVVAGGHRHVRIDAVPDHDRSLGVAGAVEDSGDALALGHADRERGQRPHQLLRALVERRGDAAVRGEGPAVHGEDPDRHAREGRGEAPEHPGLGAVCMDDVRSLAAQEHDELQQAAEIAPRAQRPPDVFERDDARAGGACRFQQWPRPVRRDDDLEFLDERREQRGHVRLGAARLGERDDDQDAGALSHCPPRGGNTTTPLGP